MASRSELKSLNRQLAEFVIDELNKAIPIRHFGRVQRSFNSFLASSTFVRIFSIYYFIRAYNDGRRAIRRPRNKPLIFFPDLHNDPRVALGYPKKVADRKRLTKRELKQAREDGTVVVTTQVNAAAGEHFIEEALNAARPKVRAAGLREIRTAVRSLIKTSKLSGTTYISL